MFDGPDEDEGKAGGEAGDGRDEGEFAEAAAGAFNRDLPVGDLLEHGSADIDDGAWIAAGSALQGRGRA